MGAMFIPVALSLLSAYTGYQGNQLSAASMQHGAAVRMQAAQFEQQQAEQQATQATAGSQREAATQKLETDYLVSRQLALAGASGAGASDPTIVNLIAQTRGIGSYKAATALYQGEEQARQLRLQGAAAMFEGESAAQDMGLRAKSYRLASYGSLLSGAGQAYGMYAKYGMGGPRSPGAPSGDSAMLNSGNFSGQG